MKNIFYASECGAKLNSNVYIGGGDDDTAAIQAILDKASEIGNVHLIMDGAALVTGLKIHSNTTIECKNQFCGFFLKNHTNKPILINANPDKDNIKDKNITILGGTYNGNNINQDKFRNEDDTYLKKVFYDCERSGVPKMVMIMQLIGVENVLIRDVTLKDQRRWAYLCCNFKNVTMENIMIDLEHHMPDENQDGLHFWGPGQYLTLKNIQGRTGDDFIALAPDEGDQKSSITDVLIDGIVLHEADQGIRLLSREKGLLDRVYIKNVIGTYKSYGFYINSWFKGSGGNFGSIIFENINLEPRTANYKYLTPLLFQIGGNVQQLILRNINMSKCDNRNILKFGYMFYMEDNDDRNDGLRSECSKMKSILIEGLHIEERSANELQLPIIQITNPIEELVIRNCEVSRHRDSDNGGCFIELDKEAEIDRLSINNINLYNVEKDIDIKNGEIINEHISEINRIY